MSYCIIGAGTAGTLLCIELIQRGVHPTKITVIDRYFDGGALHRQWHSISSNTTFQQILDAMASYPIAKPFLETLSKQYEPHQCVLLSDLGKLIQSCLHIHMKETQTIHEECISIQKVNSQWSVKYKSGSSLFDIVFLCQGGQQKHLDMGKPAIPLEIALDTSRLANYVKKGDKVTVFGIAHSGTLVIKHLLQHQCQVVGIYKGSQPFLFARDGHYDGIKQESAEIADDILQKKLHSVELISISEIPKVIKVVQKSDWIVSAIGFESSPIQIQGEDGQTISSFQYNPQTAEITNGVYGFGLAYPGITQVNEVFYKDVSIPSFKDQIQRCLPAILSLPLDGAKQDNQ